MKYGTNSELVEEVITFAKSGPLLQPQDASAQWLCVHNLDDAQRVAWERRIGKQELLWTDIREMQMANVRAIARSVADFGDMREALSQTIKLFTLVIRKRLDVEHSRLLDDIVGDLHNCAFNRAVNGATGFFEELFVAYRSGGWPCGWEGDFPSGRMVVYFRQSQKEATE